MDGGAPSNEAQLAEIAALFLQQATQATLNAVQILTAPSLVPGMARPSRAQVAGRFQLEVLQAYLTAMALLLPENDQAWQDATNQAITELTKFLCDRGPERTGMAIAETILDGALIQVRDELYS